jgi:hypothetical protein
MMNPADVVRGAEGAAVVVHAVNPPGYRDWGQLVLPMLESSIQAARASGARILLPGTIYNYGPDAFPVLREASAQNPEHRRHTCAALPLVPREPAVTCCHLVS